MQTAHQGHPPGKVTHRLYDLKTGNLLYDEKESVNMMADGTARAGGLMLLMGGGGKIKEEDRPRALTATLTIVGDRGLGDVSLARARLKQSPTGATGPATA